MRRPDFSTAATLATQPTRATEATAPIAASGLGGGGFAALVGDVQSEVAGFIDNGSASGASNRGWSPSSASLSVEGQALLQGLLGSSQAAAAPAAGADSETQQAFLASIAPWAEEAGQRLGVSPHIVAAHAALESGWGRRPLRQADGSDSHNLFGLKAGAGWQGDSTTALTTENVGGLAVKQADRFRSYADTPAAFRDYTGLLQGNPRYQGALNTGNDARAFANGLVHGGYATDPGYAEKLTRLARRLQSVD
jgi:flagellar protein FlgJ